MRRTHLSIQAAIVLSMVAFVSWPQVQQARAQSIWRYAPYAVSQARALDAARYAGPGAASVPRAAPDQPQAPAAHAPAAQAPLQLQSVPGSIAVLGGTINALLGLARNSLNAPIPYARVLLRDVGTGDVQARATADELGRFSFIDLKPNAYVVELLGPNGAVVAASSLVTISTGQLEYVEVRVPVAAPAVTATFGNRMSPVLDEVITLASSNDVTRSTTKLTPRVTSTGN